MPLDSSKTENKFQHSWLAQQLDGGVGISFWNCSGYAITLTFTPEQARRIAAELITQADICPRIGSAADLGYVEA